ncbi:MAG TPA: anti-sigma factor [Steroidobacteraceae bacterium]|nr:anti-sigma factor [Steroidobacteraceae bacterium]
MPPPAERDPEGTEPPDDDVLAGELVLGVLSAEARGAAQVRRDRDPAFAARVGAWERRLAPWLSALAPVRVPEYVWERLCRELGWRSSTRSFSLWGSLALWRGVAAFAALAAVTLWLTRPPVPPAVPTAVVPSVPEPAAKPVTTLAHNDGTPGWLASVDRTRGTVLMVPIPAPADAQGRVPELWIIPAGQAPRSLGAVSINKAHTVEVPPDSRAALVAPGSVLAITLEPASGMPHTAPSGPVIAKGAITI